MPLKTAKEKTMAKLTFEKEDKENISVKRGARNVGLIWKEFGIWKFSVINDLRSIDMKLLRTCSHILKYFLSDPSELIQIADKCDELNKSYYAKKEEALIAKEKESEYIEEE